MIFFISTKPTKQLLLLSFLPTEPINGRRSFDEWFDNASYGEAIRRFFWLTWVLVGWGSI